MTELTLELRTKAVAALRNTNLPQTTGTFRRLKATEYSPAGYCANGVIALTVFGLDPMPAEQFLIEPLPVRCAGREAVYDSALPDCQIARLNDGCWSFAEIADWLDVQPVCDPLPAAVELVDVA